VSEHEEAQVAAATATLRRHTDRGLDRDRSGVVYQRVQADLDAPTLTWRRWLAAALVSAGVGASVVSYAVCSTPQAVELARVPASPVKLTVQ
jgi:hypothetical protein